jgi:hypothetical protein
MALFLLENRDFLGFRICSIQVNGPTCADDIVLLGRSQLELQTMLLGQEQYANDERYIISEAKSKVFSSPSQKVIHSQVQITFLVSHTYSTFV